MKYTVRKSVVDIVGVIWMPQITVAQTVELSDYEVEQVKAYGDGQLTRQGLEQWLDTHAGDFQSITDFNASLEDGPDTVEIEWGTEEGRLAFADCMTSTWDAEIGYDPRA